MKYDVELVGKIGSMALIDKADNMIDYTRVARISRELKPGYIWISSGATEIGRLDYRMRNGCDLPDTEESKADYSSQGQTILMVTHSAQAASRASRVLFIKDGEVFHQIYRGEKTKEEMYQMISDTLTILMTGGEYHA
mgnify:CR=1 FL=1